MKPDIKFPAVIMVLVLVACAQTTATKSTSAEKEETRQTASAGSTSSSQTAETEQQESQTVQQAAGQAHDPEQSQRTHHPEPGQRAEPKSGAATATEATVTPKTASRPTAATVSGAQKLEQKSSSGQASAAESAEAKLAQARENLRVSQETEKRIAAGLEQLKESGNASEETVRDYETYLKSVEAMTAENRKIVTQMEAAYAKKSAAETGSNQPPANELDEMADPDIPEAQTMDEVAALDRQLDASLAEFDGMLLKEMDRIRTGSSKKLQDLAEEAAEAAKRLREQGMDVSTAGAESSVESQPERQGAPAAERETESTPGRKGTDTTAVDGSRQGAPGPSSKDQRRTDYEDDDIVARQLREAAENETDPELKEKLWKEYEEYKKSK